MMATVYDQIGLDYAALRKPDPRWKARIRGALADAESVVNVGAGTGSYEPRGPAVVALEPSRVMIRQRSADASPAVCGIAERLPFRDAGFDVALAILTIHHWSDPAAGLAELRRVAARQVVVTWDPQVFCERFWLVRDYLPEAAERERGMAKLETVVAHLQPARVEPLLVPADCTDGFFGAYWKRPHAYLDAAVRAAISGLALLDHRLVARAIERLDADLATGRWQARYAELGALSELDLGYRIVIAGG
jgi:SAM-dependent methyltransferase